MYKNQLNYRKVIFFLGFLVYLKKKQYLCEQYGTQ